jgi:protein involved in polysaccharide export with SLBB domain
MKRMVRITAFLLLVAVVCSAQTNWQNSTKGTRLGSSLEKLLDQEGQQSLQIPTQPLEEVVDESEYVVGPGDVFQFQVPGVMISFAYLVVSPEGTLIIPNTGEFLASGRSLVVLKQEIRRSFRSGTPLLTLMIPRSLVVTVLGAVERPGPYLASSVLRVDKAVSLANESSNADAASRRSASTRRIILRRKNDPDRLVDLDRFYAFRDGKDNPFMREGDIIIVPPRTIEQSAISVYGALNAPGQYEFREGDSLAAMLRIAQGLTPNADPSNVELTRFSSDGGSSETSVIDATGILGGTVPDLPLENKDRILVREKPDRRGDFKVHVRGEIRYPGMYPITRDSTKLSQIIERAGGLTEFAFLPMAEIERRQVTAEGVGVDLNREALKNLRMSDQLVTPEERAYYDLESGLRRGTVAVDFVGLFERQDASKDLALRDGDVIFIPHSQRTVYVYGQVARPGYVVHNAGADIRYYIAQAGGYGEEAETGGTRVIKGKTREWLDPSDTTIEPGDFIWVPKDIRYPTGYYMNLISQAASFISVVLSMTVIILQLSK